MAEDTHTKQHSHALSGLTSPDTTDPQSERNRPRRRFAPQLEEASVKSSRKGRTPPKQENDTGSTPVKPRKRFIPQLEETTVRASRKGVDPSPPPPTPQQAPSDRSDRVRSRFAPQLIETTQHSGQKGGPRLRQADRTDFSPGDIIHEPQSSRPSARGTSRTQEVIAGEDSSGSRFSYANLSKSRRSSVRKPTLECIHSSGSDSSDGPSFSHSAAAGQSEEPQYQHVEHLRESCDERFTGYLLAHAARLAEKQLKEQAMTAYLNENLHEPVDHFAGSRDSENSMSEQGFGMLSPVHSSSNLARPKGAHGWDPSEMRRHREALNQQRELHQKPRNENVKATQQPEVYDNGRDNVAQHPSELRQMRNAARPPLLGRSLVFPNCPSPKATRIDAYQKPRSRRYDYRHDSNTSKEHSGLWMGCTASPTLTRKNSDASAGLWGGFCDGSSRDTAATLPGRLLQSGLLTPATSTPTHELADPFSNDVHEPSRLSPWMTRSNRPHQQLPATPPSSAPDMMGIDAALSREAALEVEFPDSFITQIYNYLSLGYPALARKFDFELAKISKMSLEEIRHDDEDSDAKGYLGAPERVDSAIQMKSAREADTKLSLNQTQYDHAEGCGRWRALRLYVHEWGRQECRMREHEPRPGLQIVRRGSWLA